MTDEIAICILTSNRQQAWIRQLEEMGTPEKRIQFLMDLGRAQPQLSRDRWIPENRVVGCQSEMYLGLNWANGMLEAQIGSDALVSRGLAALVITTFQGCSAEQVLRCPFFVPERLGMNTWLTPGRSNGLHSLLTQLKKSALARLMEEA
jgi:sulfur transfer protein SufE